ncbi:MAG: hypothetical protein IJU70_05910 [Lentisphaeria bacterium]|nr:hypothetical protein [Lentisphaeria bacterium]
MGSIFEQGEAMMREAFSYASRTVDYCRAGSVLARGIPAKLGRTLFRYETPSGMTIRIEQRDFILRYSDLGIEPETGDEVVFDGEIFVVSAPNNEPCWRWHTRTARAEIRIHAKSAGMQEEGESGSSSSSSSGSASASGSEEGL